MLVAPLKINKGHSSLRWRRSSFHLASEASNSSVEGAAGCWLDTWGLAVRDTQNSAKHSHIMPDGASKHPPPFFCCKRWREASELQWRGRWSLQKHLRGSREIMSRSIRLWSSSQRNIWLSRQIRWLSNQISCGCTRKGLPARALHRCLCSTWGGTPRPEWFPETTYIQFTKNLD